MDRVNRFHLKMSTAVAFGLFVCLAFSSLPACAEEKPGEMTNQKLTGVSIMIGKNRGFRSRAGDVTGLSSGFVDECESNNPNLSRSINTGVGVAHNEVSG